MLSRNLVASGMCFLNTSCFSSSSLGVRSFMYLFMYVINCFLSNGGCSCQYICPRTQHSSLTHSFKTKLYTNEMKNTTLSYLKSEGVDNIHNLHSFFIHAFIFFTSFCRRVRPNVYVHCSLYNPLLSKCQITQNKKLQTNKQNTGIKLVSVSKKLHL